MALLQLAALKRFARESKSFVLSRMMPEPRIGAEYFQEQSLGSYYSPRGSVDYSRVNYPGQTGPETEARLSSCICLERPFHTEAFQEWCRELKHPLVLHRKLWEWYFVCQALYERGMLTAGKRGLGFAVGREPMPSLFARFGSEIVATDLDATDDRVKYWATTHQHAQQLGQLNERGLCPGEDFRRLVSYRPVDMNRIPKELRGFDFTWSTCSFEHCGSIAAGLEFLVRQMDCLKPGGVAVHTTEWNLTSNWLTIGSGPTVLFRRRDIEKVIRRLEQNGHTVEPIDLDVGTTAADRHIDPPPYVGNEPQWHLRLKYSHFVTTSVGLIIRKGQK